MIYYNDYNSLIINQEDKLIKIYYLLYRELNLRNPIYQQTSTYGHFGRDGFTWEQPKKDWSLIDERMDFKIGFGVFRF